MTADGYALLVVDMQNGFCHPDGSFPRIGRGLEGAMDAVRAAEVDGLAVSTWDAAVCDELGCGPGDLVVDKVRFDAFQWTSLEPLLRGLGVTKLMICGVVTNICVESTARSAFMRDFPVTLLEDCCAAKTRRLHELAVEVLSSYELAEIASISRGFDAGNPGAAAGRLSSPVLASA
jgi:nicotinamidase-related amidase